MRRLLVPEEVMRGTVVVHSLRILTATENYVVFLGREVGINRLLCCVTIFLVLLVLERVIAGFVIVPISMAVATTHIAETHLVLYNVEVSRVLDLCVHG